MRYVLLAAILLLISGTAHAATNGLSADYSKGVVLFGSPAGAANCKAAITGAIRYNSTNPGLQYCDGTTWQAVGGMTLISTQTASASASLLFTTAASTFSNSYNTLFLNCSGLLLTATGHNIALNVGEGAGPTWETGAHYSQQPDNVTTATDVFDVVPNLNAATDGLSFYYYIYNPGSSTLHKLIEGFYSLKSGATFYSGNISAYWNNDTNALTGVEVLTGGTTIASGTCSLYGLN